MKITKETKDNLFAIGAFAIWTALIMLIGKLSGAF